MQSYLKLFLVLTLLQFSCEKSDEVNINELSELTSLKGESGISYIESLDKWTELKELNGGSYKFQTIFLSWTGYGSITELQVEDGNVIGRIFQEFETNDSNGEREITDSYIETEVNLGNNEKGAALLTIDDLYNSCAREYLIVDEKTNTILFETEINGLMTLCGFVPNGCQDDCFDGVEIYSFDWIN